MRPDGRVVQAMVLSGGSAYAAYQVGVLKALLQGRSSASGFTPMDPDIYVGTSGGAVNAAVMTSRPGQDVLSTIDDLERLWNDRFAADPATCREGAVRIRGDLGEIANLRCLISNPALPLSRMADDAASFMQFFINGIGEALAPPPRPLGRRALAFVDAVALISTDAFARIVRQAIDLKGIRESAKVLGIATTNWRTGELRTFSNLEMSDQIGHDVILASAAFPGMEPIPIEGEPFVDGAYVLNTPLQPAISSGADELHVVFMDPDISNIPISRFDNTFDLIDKLYQITQANLFKRDIALAQDINDGLDVLEGIQLEPSQLRGVLKVLAQFRWPKGQIDTPFRQLAIHLYHPREDLGGALGLLNFELGHITSLIAKGYADAVAHDCSSSGCVLPSGGSARVGHPVLAFAPTIAIGGKPDGGMIHA